MIRDMGASGVDPVNAIFPASGTCARLLQCSSQTFAALPLRPRARKQYYNKSDRRASEIVHSRGDFSMPFGVPLEVCRISHGKPITVMTGRYPFFGVLVVAVARKALAEIALLALGGRRLGHAHAPD